MSFAEVRSKTSLPAAGRCIYCGATDRLSDEHVIPLALGGNLYLPKASCPKCRDLTSVFELRVLRGFMFRARVAGSFPTRRPVERPAESAITLLDGDAPRETVLPRGTEPALLQLPIFEPPRFLQGQPIIRGINVSGMETIHFGADLEATIRMHGAAGFRQTDSVDATSLARMLAKIGYSYTVGVFGFMPLDQVLVLPFIRGESDDSGHWIGSATFSTESERFGALHALTHIVYETQRGSPSRVLVARVKLFASFGATGFEVIVRGI